MNSLKPILAFALATTLSSCVTMWGPVEQKKTETREYVVRGKDVVVEAINDNTMTIGRIVRITAYPDYVQTPVETYKEAKSVTYLAVGTLLVGGAYGVAALTNKSSDEKQKLGYQIVGGMIVIGCLGAISRWGKTETEVKQVDSRTESRPHRTAIGRNCTLSLTPSDGRRRWMIIGQFSSINVVSFRISGFLQFAEYRFRSEDEFLDCLTRTGEVTVDWAFAQ